MVIIKRV